MTGCPRTEVHSTAIQLLQVLDKRFFGTVGPLQGEIDRGEYRRHCTKYTRYYTYIYGIDKLQTSIGIGLHVRLTQSKLSK